MCCLLPTYHTHRLPLGTPRALDFMAAVSIPVSPHAIGVMATQRLPLASIPNGTNSPYPRKAVTPVKRTRSRSNAGENTPPLKKQLTDEKCPPKTPTHKATSARVDKKIQVERQIIGRTLKQDRTDADTQPLETVLQWQRHFRKVFPSYVFYFENIPEDTRRRCVRSIESLGAVCNQTILLIICTYHLQREAKFFSKEVTHVITTRVVPTDEDLSQDREADEENDNATNHENIPPQTINPSLLNKNVQQLPGLQRTKFNFDIASIRKGSVPSTDFNIRKPASSGLDILQKAKELGIKIWQLEKLWRVLKTISGNSTSNEGQISKNSAVMDNRTLKQVDLSQMIKNEKIHERGDREINTAATELIKLSGPYLYVRDMNEKTKPILVREYPKVDRKEEGEWPQFRSASTGKCPFLEDEAQPRKMKEKEYREDKPKRIVYEQTRARVQDYPETKTIKPTMQPPTLQARRRPLVETISAANSARQAYQLPPPPARNDSTFTTGTNQGANVLGPKLINGEPTASGVQPSNITSAIRSQMVSSTAAAPGAKAGTSKEIHDLQRKAIERSVGLQHSQRMYDIASYNRAARAVTRAAAKEPVMAGGIEEQKPRSRVKNVAEEEIIVHAPHREEKTGYCENCREKFKDFDEVSIR